MPKRRNKVKKPRIAEIDFIRGVLIWFMVVDHFFYDFLGGSIIQTIFPTFRAGIISVANFYWGWEVRIVARFIILSLFFLISGFSCYFSRNNLKRGLILFGLGGLIDLAFFIGGKYILHDTSMYVFFGAISCFGMSILIYWLLKFLFDKFSPNHHEDFKWIILALGLMIIGVGVMFNVFSFYGPRVHVSNITWSNFLLVVIGMYEHQGADWLPLFPYLGFLLVGVFLGELIYKEKKSLFTCSLPHIDNKSSLPRKVNYYGVVMPYKGVRSVFTFSGHYSIFFYIFHQPILILFIGVVLLIMGYRISL